MDLMDLYLRERMSGWDGDCPRSVADEEAARSMTTWKTASSLRAKGSQRRRA